MNDPVQRLAAAQRDSAAARARLSDTLSTLQARLEPRLLAREAAEEAKDRGRLAAKAGASAAKRNPGAVAAAVTLLGLFAIRRRIAALYRRSRGATGGRPPR